MSQAILDKLRAEYLNLTVQKKVVRAQVKAEFEAKIQVEVKKRIAEAEAEFARNLADAKETYALPVVTIQDEVFRTRTWSRWEKWRDLMGIAPERKTAEGARALKKTAEKPYRVENGKILVTRNESGPIEAFPISSVNRAADGESYVFWPPMTASDPGREAFQEAFGNDVNRLSRFLNAAYAEYEETPEEYEED